MKTLRFIPRWKTATGWALALSTILVFARSSFAQPGTVGYRPGEVVSGFSSVLRRAWFNENTGQFVSAGGTVHLEDFAGKILFIQYYDPFCSICLEGISQTTVNINDFYKKRNGNANGIPVVYMAINLESADYAHFPADTVLDYRSVDVRANDYKDGHIDISVNLFATHNSKPVFVAINCVANSPGRRQYELLLNKSGVVESQIAGLITEWRTVIDAVEAPPPSLEPVEMLGDSTFEFAFYGRLNTTYRVASTTNFSDWDFGAPFIGTNGPVIVPINTESGAQRFFQIISP